MAGNPLKPVCVIGLVLALIVSWGIVLFGVIWRGDFPGPAHNVHGAMRDSFARELRDFDLFDAPRRVLAGENPAQIERRLSRLQRQARSVEEHLSVLKRRRELALLDRRYIVYYERAAREAAETFPFSSPLAIVAAEAVILGNPPDARSLLGTYAGRVTQAHLRLFELAIHALAGNLDDPVRAAGIPGMENLLSHDFSGVLSGTTGQNLHINEFLLRAVRGDISGASARLNTLLNAPERDDPGIQRMAAEFFYDHNNPRRAAELFARLVEQAALAQQAALAAQAGLGGGIAGDMDIIRLADSLALAGEIPGARNIWFALSANPNPAGSLPDEPVLSRVFYNMASSSTDRQEEALWLERLFSHRAQRGQNPMDNTGIYSVIRYTRLLDTPRGIAALESESVHQQPLLDLELLRRRLDIWPPNRAAAEVWLLLNRHPEDQAIHEWAAWYFEHRRLYTESARLLNDAMRNGMTGTWLDLHRALALLRRGEIDGGERLLREAGTGSRDWRIFANLGRIHESHRQISAALEAYEAAAVLVDERIAAAQVQMRISRNLEALGRRQESRAAMERALELDPDDLTIRRELRRLGSR